MTSASANAPIAFGGSAAAIRHHYDVGNDFYAAWLDPTMTYSCAMWDGLPASAPLEDAQRRKLEFHAHAVGAAPGMRVLDVGCGWGSMLRTLREGFGVEASVGLTLSDAQAAHVRALGLPGVEVLLSNWHDYHPELGFDAIVSIGAFEHFAHPRQSVAERREVYRGFFARCREWLRRGGALSLQTIAYGTMAPDQANPFITTEIFPDAELPTLADIVAASEGLLRIDRLREDGLDYARTCELWSARLRGAVRDGAVREDFAPARAFSRYLRLSAAGFRLRKIALFRMRLIAD